jgi:hypothetical protein
MAHGPRALPWRVLSDLCGSEGRGLISRAHELQIESQAAKPGPVFPVVAGDIRLVVVMYVRFPLSLRNVEDLLFERSIGNRV